VRTRIIAVTDEAVLASADDLWVVYLPDDGGSAVTNFKKFLVCVPGL
jgi:hypothetical protein